MLFMINFRTWLKNSTHVTWPWHRKWCQWYYSDGILESTSQCVHNLVQLSKITHSQVLFPLFCGQFGHRQGGAFSLILLASAVQTMSACPRARRIDLYLDAWLSVSDIRSRSSGQLFGFLSVSLQPVRVGRAVFFWLICFWPESRSCQCRWKTNQPLRRVGQPLVSTPWGQSAWREITCGPGSSLGILLLTNFNWCVPPVSLVFPRRRLGWWYYANNLYFFWSLFKKKKYSGLFFFRVGNVTFELGTAHFEGFS